MDIRIQVVISEIFNTLHTRTHSATECFCSPTRYYLIDVATNFKHLQTCSFGNKNSMVCVFGICVCSSGWTSVCSNSPSRPLHPPISTLYHIILSHLFSFRHSLQQSFLFVHPCYLRSFGSSRKVSISQSAREERTHERKKEEPFQRR